MTKPQSVVVGVAMLASCTEAPVAPDIEPAFAGPGTVNYVITGWEGGVWSDGFGDMDAGIGPDGSFSFDAGGKSKKANPEICVDLSTANLVAIHDQDTYDLFVGLVASDPNSGGMAAVCSEAAVHTRDHSNEAEMPVGTIEHAGGKIVLKDYAERNGSWEWRLVWDLEGTFRDLPDRGKGICIHHAAENTWHIYNDDDVAVDPPAGCDAAGSTIDNIMRLTRYGGSDQLLVAEFRVPFRFSFVVR